MIVRVFRARVHPGKEDEFGRFVIETGFADGEGREGLHTRDRGDGPLE
jgi:hypothetical protein